MKKEKVEKELHKNLHISQNVCTFAPANLKGYSNRDVAQLVSARVWGA